MLSHLQKWFANCRWAALLLLLGLAHFASAATQEVSDGRPVSAQSLGLTLIGRLTHQKQTQLSVVLLKENSSNKVIAAKVGQFILGDYQIFAIREKYITLIPRSGEKILVYQDKFAAEFKPVMTAANSSEKMQPSQWKESYRENGFERSKTNIQMTASYRDKIVKQDLSKILMQATAEPNYVNGQIQGFRFSQIDADSVFAKGGLLDNDIVSSINDQPLNNVAAAIALLNTLKGANEVRLEVIRNGSPLRFSIAVN